LTWINFKIPTWRTRKAKVAGALVLAGALGGWVWLLRRDRRSSRLTPPPAESEQGMNSDTRRAGRPRWLLRLALAALSVTFGLMLVEGACRVLLYLKYQDPNSFTLFAIDSPSCYFDEEIGYRHRPSCVVRLRQFDTEGNETISSSIHINSSGHISLREDTVEKAPEEFRIALLGDSFTACTFNDVPWGSTLETLCNERPELKKLVGAGRISVINFGMAGTGVVQWPAVLEHEVRKYRPDLVVVSLISDDVDRKFKWSKESEEMPGGYRLILTSSSLPVSLGNQECRPERCVVLTPSHDDQSNVLRIHRELRELQCSRTPWFAPYPFLAQELAGRLGIPCPIASVTGPSGRYASMSDAVEASVRALQTIRSAQEHVLTLHIPMWWEILGADVMPYAVGELLKADKTLEIEPMMRRMFEHGKPADRPDILRWYNQPYDAHFSNTGARVYAEAVYSKVCEYAAARIRCP
jgi:hypothetical protein